MQPLQGRIAAVQLPFSFGPHYLAFTKRSCFMITQFEKETVMAAYETSRTAPLGAISIFRLVQSFSDVGSTVRGWNDARITRKALGKLTDRELDDIGLCRGDIEMIGR